MTRPPVVPPEDCGTDAERLLDEVQEALCTYVAFPSAACADAVTLWVAATHAQPGWDHAPRLAVVSPIKRCGKSRLMDCIEALSHSPLISVNCSTAAIVRSMSDEEPITLLIDEADTIFGRAKGDNHEDVRGILNAGHQRNRPYVRWDITIRSRENCPTFGMAMLASIGDLPDTIMDRAVIVRMRRRMGSERVAPWRARKALPPLHELRERVHEWARGVLDELGNHEPEMPVEDRAADTWEPLVCIADLAGGTWPMRSRQACRALTVEDDPDDGTAGERLLADLRDVFRDADKLATSFILEALQQIEEAPWGDWYGRPLTARVLARLLKPYGVKSRTIRLADGTTPKGYHAEDLRDAWERYLRTSSATNATPPQSSIPADEASGAFVAEDLSRSATGSDQGVREDRGAVAAVAQGIRDSGEPLF